ncbi:MAG: signal recognition particle-docking protein FtsY [Christensenellales bacterium]
MGLIKSIKNAFKKTKEYFARRIDTMLSNGELNEDFYDELEELLISSDVGVSSSIEIVENLRLYARKNKIRTANEVREALKLIVSEMFVDSKDYKFEYPCVISIVGVNGVGKTTTIGKLAHYFKSQKKDVSLVAGDTFRAAAADQLSNWAKRVGVKIIRHNEGADAAAVVFDGISSAKAKKTDVLIVDTAGRLHTKTNLMEELKKIDRVITREYPQAHRYNFIVLDATTGQNALNQIKAFDEFVKIDGIILTKLDGTAKGGVVISIQKDYGVPVVFVGTGEGMEDLEIFDPKEFAESLF